MLETFKKLPDNKQSAIFDAAAGIFAQKGYYQANIADICKAAGISNGALYKYFKNKEDLFISVAGYGIELMRVELFGRLKEHGSVFNILRNVFEQVLDFLEHNKNYTLIYLDVGSRSMDKFAYILSEKVEEPARTFWVELVKTGKQNGEINKKLNNKSAAYLIDNHLMLFSFSCVSEHHDRRFNIYFGTRNKRLRPREKIDIVMTSLKQLLQ
ncbi:MAG: TetR/AcrR family transcriptional regulator [Desulfobacteraceae bacterium]|nr:TetR/AcrR family transcriptional regulator [Desulfobacteraceae bacterium]MCP4346027.1 TetR/AcrR family transcriptional regulator [Desulfobacterales bacterium]